MCSEASSKTVQRIDPHQVRSQASGAQLVTGSLEDHQELSVRHPIEGCSVFTCRGEGRGEGKGGGHVNLIAQISTWL